MSNVNNEKMKEIIRKIKNTLRLAGDATDDEGKSALLKAQQLMIKYNVSIENTNGVENKESKNVVEGDGTEPTKLKWWMKQLAKIIADNFKCYVYVKKVDTKTKICFLGFEEDVAICIAVYDYAITCIKFYSEVYIKQTGQGGNRALTIAIKNDFISGYLLGLKDRFKEQVKSEGFALMLQKDSLVTKKYEELSLTVSRQKGVSSKGDINAKNTGYAQGKQFYHDRKRIED